MRHKKETNIQIRISTIYILAGENITLLSCIGVLTFITV
jgi:hypothetical protein